MNDNYKKEYGGGIGCVVSLYIWRLTHTMGGQHSETVAESRVYNTKKECGESIIADVNKVVAERTTGLPKQGEPSVVRNITYDENGVVMTESLIHPNEPNIPFVKDVWRWEIVKSDHICFGCL